MKLIEIENVIPATYQDAVEAETTSESMEWFMTSDSVGTPMFNKKFTGFTHIAFQLRETDHKVSAISPLLIPILFTFCEKAKLKFNKLLRTRIGLFTNLSSDAKHHNPHIDFVGPHYTAVYYVNDSDGDTFIFNETSENVTVEQSVQLCHRDGFTIAARSSPKKGKMICFDGIHYHASMHPTNAPTRIAITFNFI